VQLEGSVQSPEKKKNIDITRTSIEGGPRVIHVNQTIERILRGHYIIIRSARIRFIRSEDELPHRIDI
jgi:hypothetical protein